jgi:hypothetical protein
MAAWRREALTAFPELRTELNDVGDMFSVHQLWFRLLPWTWRAHQDGDEDFLRRVYAYAEWCHRASPELKGAVVVCFYEHLVDNRQDLWWARVMPRLSDAVIVSTWPEWKERLMPAELDRVRKVLRDQGRPLPPDNPDHARAGGRRVAMTLGAHHSPRSRRSGPRPTGGGSGRRR